MAILSMSIRMIAAAMAMVGGTLPLHAQERQGQVAQSSVGSAGERQSQTAAVPGRLQTRITSRVQSRLRNRIDRFYDPTHDAVSSFEDANTQVKAVNR
jgi:hypothetical protein